MTHIRNMELGVSIGHGGGSFQLGVDKRLSAIMFIPRRASGVFFF